MSSFNLQYLFGAVLKNKTIAAGKTTFCNVNHIKMNFFHASNTNYAMKSNLPVKWIRPEKIPCFHPKKSGDLQPLENVDSKKLALEYKDLEEIKSADEKVKKLFTLEFLPYKSTVSYLRHDYMNKVQRHELDMSSPEARVAKMTANIRVMQIYVEKFPHDKRTKVRLKETIDKRKKLLKRLREWDYKCFEYVIEKLDLIYKPFPPKDVYRRIERKRSLRMLTDKLCENIVSEKLQKYKEELESSKENFLIEKLETLKWIMKEEAYCGVPPTVTNDHLKCVEEEIRKLRESKKTETRIVNE